MPICISITLASVQNTQGSHAKVKQCADCPKIGHLQDDISKKIEKWQELPPAKTKNVLPVPDLEPKKRRGGKRYRKMKEKYGLTDVQKAANRIQFGKAEEEFLDGEEVVGLGMVGKEGTGNLRKLQVRFLCTLRKVPHSRSKALIHVQKLQQGSACLCTDPVNDKHA